MRAPREDTAMQKPGLKIAPVSPRPEAVTPRRILVVEDHDDSRAGLRVLLELDGHKVAEANDGAQALATTLIFRPHVALIDIGLPGTDGYEVARQIRASSEGQEIVLVALTGYGQPEDRERAMKAGFNAHLLKPIKADRLAQVLSTDSAKLG